MIQIIEFVGDFSQVDKLTIKYRLEILDDKELADECYKKDMLLKEKNIALQEKETMRNELLNIKSSRGYRYLQLLKKLKNYLIIKNSCKK